MARLGTGKGYSFNPKTRKYIIRQRYNGRQLVFGYCDTELEAIKLVRYLRLEGLMK